ncbi:MAG TPA: HAMP domain-containing sensor histidine kinase, partial [Candidatus Binatia bacterium]|nr:HAMP domain-containing sensor histidine kinase [Candidatus Binatia bacterium]
AIRRNADRLKVLVDDLLDISWIETGRADLKRQPVDLTQILRKEIEEHVKGRLQHENRAIDLILDVEPGLPPVHADSEKVTRIVMNLVDNAINYTPDGGVIEIRASTSGSDEGADGLVYVSVSDTGAGISHENLDRIFERFYRVEDGSIQETPGTGLGLSIVRSLVEMHGGSISVESELGHGSTFIFSLPYVERERLGQAAGVSARP